MNWGVFKEKEEFILWHYILLLSGQTNVLITWLKVPLPTIWHIGLSVVVNPGGNLILKVFPAE